MSELLGQKICRETSFQVSETFRNQFCFSPQELEIPEFTHQVFAGRHLYCSDKLPVTRILDPKRRPIGLVLGLAVDEQNVLGSERVLGKTGEDRNTTYQDIERFAASLAGRFVLIADINGKPRVYTDTVSSYSVVFDKKTGVVASSLFLCLVRDIDPNNTARLPASHRILSDATELIPDQDPNLPDHGYFFGQTVDKHVFRVPGNHYLDVSEREIVRYRQNDPLGDFYDVRTAAEMIAGRLQQIMGAISTQVDGYLALSGGRDSRLLLACSPGPDRSRLVPFSYATNWMSTLDVRVADVLSRHYGKPILQFVHPDGPKRSYFKRRTRSQRLSKRLLISNGLSGETDAWWKNGHSTQIKSDVAWVRGNYLEIVTARYWPKRKLGSDDEIWHLLGRGGIPSQGSIHGDRFFDQAKGWMQSFGHDICANLYDLAYMELTLSRSQAWFHGPNMQYFVGPANDLSIFDTAMRVRPEQRMGAALNDEILRITYPELLDLPYAKSAVFRSRYSPESPEEILSKELEFFEQRYFG